MISSRGVPAVPIVVALAVVTSLGVGTFIGLGPGLLVLSGSVLLASVFLLWSSLERLSGEATLTVEEAIGLGAPTAEEERKQAVLRALKDLEYERSVGKVSEEDFAELSARYRADAKRLLQTLDTELAPLRRRAEERLSRRLSSQGADRKRESRSVAKAEADATKTASRACSACGTPNDADARFCKQCAAPLEGETP